MGDSSECKSSVMVPYDYLNVQMTSIKQNGGSALPSLEEVFSHLRRISIGSTENSTILDRSTFVVTRGGGHGGRGGAREGQPCRGSGGGPMYGRGGGGMYSRGGGCVGGQDLGGARGRGHSNGQRRCTHCGMKGHTINFCYDQHGPPSTWANHVVVTGGGLRQESQHTDQIPSTSTDASRKETLSVP
ncbi:PREDICTED: RNA-binding protein cabeza-like [Nelumbo nucifera]|uniref:RNA-binding protein cabeza-like n=1 Tax=Nelumbo nucifera TaxID=4432 RepID=A0A1U7Z6C5_NELNU|nr:PREDICTED: RNA-binding protein cabeza-like [Nelumbo nucifera]